MVIYVGELVVGNRQIWNLWFRISWPGININVWPIVHWMIPPICVSWIPWNILLEKCVGKKLFARHLLLNHSSTSGSSRKVRVISSIRMFLFSPFIFKLKWWTRVISQLSPFCVMVAAFLASRSSTHLTWWFRCGFKSLMKTMFSLLSFNQPRLNTLP